MICTRAVLSHAIKDAIMHIDTTQMYFKCYNRNYAIVITIGIYIVFKYLLCNLDIDSEKRIAI